MKLFIVSMAAFGLLMLARSFAHCDGLNGPVVKAAQTALESGELNHVLIWIQKKDESAITAAFQKTLAVRKLGFEAKSLADNRFFEILVRIHRAGEGAPYTGLKPAGRDLGPAIPAADKALGSGSLTALAKLVENAVHGGLEARFKETAAKRKYKKADVAAGREYVKSYVEYIHYVERIYDAAKNSTEGHYREGEEAGAAKRSQK